MARKIRPRDRGFLERKRQATKARARVKRTGLGLTTITYTKEEPQMNRLAAIGIACALSSPAYAGVPVKDTKVSAELMALASDVSISQRSSASTGTDNVVIDTAASGDPEALAADLRALGAHKVTVFGRMVSSALPSDAIPSLENLDSLKFARRAYTMRHTGSVNSQGDAAMRADVGRTTFGVDGTGVMVGTLSDSYNCLGGADSRVASGDLPRDVLVLEDGEGPCPATDEGQTMMEIIHDIAPGATQAFHSALHGEAGFARGIIALADAGAKIINDDVLHLAEPMFQDGVIAQAVDTVKARGVSYFSAAGNLARQSYEAPFRPTGHVIDIGVGRPSEAHDFDPGPSRLIWTSCLQTPTAVLMPLSLTGPSGT
jgi:hypothetical protein